MANKIETVYVDPEVGDIGFTGQMLGYVDTIDNVTISIDAAKGNINAQGSAYFGDSIYTNNSLTVNNKLFVNNGFQVTGNILLSTTKPEDIISMTGNVFINGIIKYNNSDIATLNGNNKWIGTNTFDILIAPTMPVDDVSGSVVNTAFASRAFGNLKMFDNTWLGINTFNKSPIVPNKSIGDTTTSAANTSFVTNSITNLKSSDNDWSGINNFDGNLTYNGFDVAKKISSIGDGWTRASLVSTGGYDGWAGGNSIEIGTNGYGCKIFVCTCYEYYTYWSNDGKIWFYASETGAPTKKVSKGFNVKFAPDKKLFVMNSANGFWYSIYGWDWQKSNITSGSYQDDIFYENGILFTASYYSPNYGGVSYSLDGKIWNSSKVSNDLYTVNHVCYGNGMFLAVGSGSKNGLWKSTDNLSTWNPVTTLPEINCKRVFFVNNKWFVQSSTTSNFYISNDSITWKPLNLITGYNPFIAYNNGVYVLVTSEDIYYSYDGENWSIGKYDIPKNYLTGVVTFVDNKWIIAVSGPRILTSYDGINWTAINNITISNGNMGNFVYNDESKLLLLSCDMGVVFSESKIGV